jgi:hypothetical protein
LEFYVVVQLHLALSSPIASIKRDNERKFSRDLRKRNRLALVIRQLKIRKPLSDGLIHDAPPITCTLRDAIDRYSDTRVQAGYY